MAKRIIVNLERGSRNSRNGTQSGMYVTFKNPDTGQTGKPNFLVDQYNADIIQTCEQAGLNATVDVQYKQNNGFWNIVGVSVLSPGGGNAPVAGPPSNPGMGQQQPKQAAPQQPVVVAPRDPDEMLRHSCLKLAVKFQNAMARLAGTGSHKKVFPPTKTTPDVVFDDTLARAAKMVAFVKGEINPLTDSDAQDLDPKGVDMDQPEIPETPGEMPT